MVDKRTQQVSEYIAGGLDAVLSSEHAALARLHLLDTLASIVACRDLDAATVARRYVTSWGAPAATIEGPGRSATILGTSDRAALVDAVFAGAMTAHGAEINDFVPSVFVQPGPAIVTAALGVGEATGASIEDIVRAISVGYEMAVRVPRALGVGNLRRAGLANHGVGPCFGAAAAAAALLRLSSEQVAHVLSFTAQQASGSWQWLLDVEHIEKAFVFAGLGARNGLQAALLVEAGFRGVPEVIDRPGTWFTSASFSHPDGDGDLDALVDGLGVSNVFDAVAYKRYPVGGPTQPAVEALLDMVSGADAGHTLSAADIARVTIEMPGRTDAFRDAAMPALNLRYLTAIIVIDGTLDFVAAQSLERMHGDPEVRRLMDLVDVVHDSSQEAAPGTARTESARVTAQLVDGRTVERFVPHVLGFPSHPMPPATVEAKALDLISPHLGHDRASALVEACRSAGDDPAASLAALIAR